MFIYNILDKYNHKPYYKNNDYISINDDRVGCVVSFKIYKDNDGTIYADFNERYRHFQISECKRTSNKVIITSLEDFKKKWHKFYNCY